MPATFEQFGTGLDAPYLNRIPLNQTGYKVNVDDPGGCQIRITHDGMSIYMLYREPGVYYNDHARKVPEELAREAGFDVERWGKARRRLEARKRAMDAIDADFDVGPQSRVVWAEGEYRVVEIAPGYFNVEFVDEDAPEGEKYTVLNGRGPVGLDVARRRFEELTGTTVSAEAEAASQPAEAPDAEKPAAKKAR